MKQSKVDCVADGKKSKKIAAPPPLPTPPTLRFSSSRKLSVEQMAAASLTNIRRLLKYWKQKPKTAEEVPFKAAARNPARETISQ